MNEDKEIERFSEKYGEMPLFIKGCSIEERQRWEDKLDGVLWRAHLDRTEEAVRLFQKIIQQGEIDDEIQSAITAFLAEPKEAIG